MSNIRITQSDVARAAGVHNTTVSLALRNSPLIPPATRDRIKKIADSMGYQPDPALRALATYRKACRGKRETGTLAYVSNWPSQWGWLDLPEHKAHYEGARRKAEQLGYHLEHFWLGEAGMTQRRFDSVLLHRGIRGVLFAASRFTCAELSELNWARLTAVRLGGFPHVPALDLVTTDTVAIVKLAVSRVLSAGYCRVGLMLSHRWDKLTDQVWSAAFHAEQYRCHLRHLIPVLRLQSPLEETPLDAISAHDAANDASALLYWRRQYRPDVVIGSCPAVREHLQRSGFLVPGDFAYANLLSHQPDPASAGVWVDYARLGELAVEKLASQLEKNELGPPATATSTLMGGSWRDGASLPLRQGAAPEADHPAPSLHASLA